MTRQHKWNWRDLYRFPIVLLVLWPIVRFDYRERRRGRRPDRWHWADVLMMEWGYCA